MDNQLQELIELQKEQNQLLKKHLTRIRFSLWALLGIDDANGSWPWNGRLSDETKTNGVSAATAKQLPYAPSFWNTTI